MAYSENPSPISPQETAQENIVSEAPQNLWQRLRRSRNRISHVEPIVSPLPTATEPEVDSIDEANPTVGIEPEAFVRQEAVADSHPIEGQPIEQMDNIANPNTESDQQQAIESQPTAEPNAAGMHESTEHFLELLSDSQYQEAVAYANSLPEMEILDLLNYLIADDGEIPLKFFQKHSAYDTSRISEVIQANFEALWPRMSVVGVTALIENGYTIPETSQQLVFNLLLRNRAILNLEAHNFSTLNPVDMAKSAIYHYCFHDLNYIDCAASDREEIVKELIWQDKANYAATPEFLRDLDKQALVEFAADYGISQIFAGGMNSLSEGIDWPPFFEKVAGDKVKLLQLLKYKDVFKDVDQEWLYMLYCNAGLQDTVVATGIFPQEVAKLTEQEVEDLILRRYDQSLEFELEDVMPLLQIYHQSHPEFQLSSRFINKILDWDTSPTDPCYGFTLLDMYKGNVATLENNVAQKLIDQSSLGWVISNQIKFPNLSREQMIEYGFNAKMEFYLVLNLNSFDSEGQIAIVSRIINNLDWESLGGDSQLSAIVACLAAHPEYHPKLIEVWTKILSDENKISDTHLQTYFSIIKQVVPEAIPEPLKVHQQLLGDEMSVESVLAIESLLQNRPVPSDLTELGVTTTGREGLEQLRQRVTHILEKLHSDSFSEADLDLLTRSSIALSSISKITGYDKSSWGRGHLQETAEYYAQAKLDGRIAPLPEGYSSSQSYEVTNLNTSQVEWTEDITNKYSSLRSEITAALEINQARHGITQALAALRLEISQVIGQTEAELVGLDQSAPAAKRQALQTKRDTLTEFLDQAPTAGSRFIMNDKAAFANSFDTLQQFKEFHPAMRQAIFAWGIKQNPLQAEALRNLTQEPSMDSIAAVREFIEHIVNQETYGDYFESKNQAKNFAKLSSTKTLELGMSRSLERADKNTGTIPVQFMPSRGLLTEMSGQIADACWAEKYSSITEKFPNIISVAMKVRPGQGEERIVGAALLIETTNPDTNEGVLVLRGCNPKQNFINKVDVAEFYQAMTDYVTQQASVRGLIPAVAIDDHSGGAATNRPVLWEYMNAQVPLLTPILVNSLDSTFNGYDISRNVYSLVSSPDS